MRADSMTQEKIYTVSEVADILRVTARTVRRMIADRELEAFVIRDEYRIRQSALERVMQNPPRQEK